MKYMARILALVLAGQIDAGVAVAGIADSPLPILDPAATTLHLYSVPGIVRNGSYAAYFACTSTDTASVKVAVDVFASSGALITDPAFSTLTVAPGGTVVFSTGSSDWLVPDLELGTGGIVKFSARILATSKKVACTAFTAKSANNGGDAAPTSPLTIIAKTKQKAAN